MSRDDLRVTTAHLGDLAVHQGRAAAEIRSARLAAEGVDAAVRSTHGSIASATVSALEAALSTRHSAATRMAAISDELCDKLTGAAKRYEMTDDAMGSALDAEMQAGRP
jgi:Excreted virulence factor EspC, type VII ESX diderm